MKKYLLILGLVLVAVIPIFAIAQTTPETGQACFTGTLNGTLCNALPRFGGVENIDTLPEFIIAVMAWIGSLIGTLALVMIMFGGFRMMTSQGDPKAITQGKTTLTYAVSGLVVVLFAYVIVSSVIYFLGADDLEPGSTQNTGFFNPLPNTDLLFFVNSTIRSFLGVLGAIAILYIVISGFRLITSGGNEEQAKKGKQGLQWAVVGLVCVIISYLIVTVVINSVRGLG